MMQKRSKADSEKAIGETTALRWEPTHVTKPNPRVVPLHKLGKSPRSLVEIQVKYIYHSLLVYIAYTRQSHTLSHGHVDQ